ncbi:MAG: OmpA family protein [Bacteroidales bacterium]|nr:OmpA family protein [Bacteroidales bacterium]
MKPNIKQIIAAAAITFVFYEATNCQSENLVVNPGFEEYSECPKGYTPQDRTHKLIPGWSYPTIATPDYFNKCATKLVGVPKNFAGESAPQSGKAYMGAILSGTDDGYREYIQGHLSKPLVEGKMYCITYYYKLASYSKFAVDQLSIYLSEIEVKNELKVNLPYKPQINNKVGLFLDNIEEWNRTCTIYKASGKEKYFIIGNFKSYENTNYVATDKNMKNLMNKEYAYYYFDDISIKPLDNCMDCPCVKHDFEAEIIDSTYTGGYDPFVGQVQKLKNDGRIRINMIGGTPPYTVKWNNGMVGKDLRNLAAGTYSFVAYDSYNCQSKGTIVFKEPEIVVNEFKEGLETIEEGASIVLENIYFEFNKTNLKPESFPELDKVVAFIMDNDMQLVEIAGHTDSDGSEAYNLKLSDGRAKSVVEYLVNKGVPAQRLKSVGYGESKPIDTNTIDEGKERNRRVEFTLLKK